MSDFETRQAIRHIWKAIYELNESFNRSPGYDKVKAELMKSGEYLRKLMGDQEFEK